MLRAILCDNDGCLQSEALGPLDLGGLGVLQAWNQEARRRPDALPELTICSGRPLPYVEAMCRVLDVRLPAVAENGVWLWLPDEYRAVRDPSISDADLEAVEACSHYCETDLRQLGFDRQPGKTCSVTLWHESTEQLMELVPQLTQRVEREAWPFRVSASESHLNLDLEQIDKGSGIRRVKEITGFDASVLGAIGDTSGDLAMRPEVAWFGCPANAIPEVQAVSDDVAEQEELVGVRTLLEALSKRR